MISKYPNHIRPRCAKCAILSPGLYEKPLYNSNKPYNITKYFAGLYDSDIYGIYVNTPLYYPVVPNFMYYAGYIVEVANKKKILIENKFKKLKNQLSKSRINFSGKIVKGEIDDEIKKFSKSKKTDLISIGNSGK